MSSTYLMLHSMLGTHSPSSVFWKKVWSIWLFGQNCAVTSRPICNIEADYSKAAGGFPTVYYTRKLQPQTTNKLPRKGKFRKQLKLFEKTLNTTRTQAFVPIWNGSVSTWKHTNQKWNAMPRESQSCCLKRAPRSMAYKLCSLWRASRKQGRAFNHQNDMGDTRKLQKTLLLINDDDDDNTWQNVRKTQACFRAELINPRSMMYLTYLAHLVLARTCHRGGEKHWGTPAATPFLPTRHPDISSLPLHCSFPRPQCLLPCIDCKATAKDQGLS